MKGAGIRDRTGAGPGYAKDAGNMLPGVNLEGKLRASKAVALVEKKKLENTLLLVCAGFLSVDRDGRVCSIIIVVVVVVLLIIIINASLVPAFSRLRILNVWRVDKFIFSA